MPPNPVGRLPRRIEIYHERVVDVDEAVEQLLFEHLREYGLERFTMS